MDMPEVLSKKLEEFEKFSSNLTHEHTNEISSQPPPTHLYHYTNYEGLKGILESGELHLTNVFNLNDPSEIRYGFSHVINSLKKLSTQGSNEQKYFARRFEHLYTTGINRTGHFFVCSFSKDDDELGQWRSYADDGRGYCLVFDRSELEDIFLNASQVTQGQNNTFDIRYDNRIHNLHHSLAQQVSPLIDLPNQLGIKDPGRSNFLQYLSVYLSLHALQSSLFYKHKGYETEKEYRFLQVFNWLATVPNIHHKHKKDELISYTKTKWKDEKRFALKEVIIGPAADKNKSEKFLMEYSNFLKFPQIQIRYSNIPYRSQK